VWPLITINKLLKSCATPPASLPTAPFLRLPQLFFELLPLANILRNDETHAPASVFEFIAQRARL